MLNRNFQDLLNDLRIKIDEKDFDGSMMEDLDRDEFWKEVLQYMDSDANKSVPMIRENIYNNSIVANTIFKEIVKKIDLDGDEDPNNWDKRQKQFMSNIKTILTEQNLWNPSVSKIIKNFYGKIDENFSKEEQEINRTPNTDWTKNEEPPYQIKNGALTVGYKTEDGEERPIKFKISDIKNADAGYSFRAPYVRPQYNVDEETYLYVRDDDRSEYALTNDKELQYTRKSKENNWIRLLMPKYLRYVEVEDLNRNFWIISQVLTAISAYTFGDNSYHEIYEFILSEIAQLWENILYLWILSLIQSQKYYANNHFEMVYLSQNNFQNSFSYNNFSGENYFVEEQGVKRPDWHKISKNLEYLIQDYPESNLYIIPVIRMGNYKSNFYNKIAFPGVWEYNRNEEAENQVKTLNFSISQQDNTIFDENYSIPCINLTQEYYQTHLYGIEEKEVTYKYTYPLSDVDDIDAVNNTYCLVDSVCEIFEIIEEDDIEKIKVKFNFIDYGKFLIEGEEQENSNIIFSLSGERAVEGEGDFVLTASSYVPVIVPDSDEKIIERGFFQGDLASARVILPSNEI